MLTRCKNTASNFLSCCVSDNATCAFEYRTQFAWRRQDLTYGGGGEFDPKHYFASSRPQRHLLGRNGALSATNCHDQSSGLTGKVWQVDLCRKKRRENRRRDKQGVRHAHLLNLNFKRMHVGWSPGPVSKIWVLNRSVPKFRSCFFIDKIHRLYKSFDTQDFFIRNIGPTALKIGPIDSGFVCMFPASQEVTQYWYTYNEVTVCCTACADPNCDLCDEDDLSECDICNAGYYRSSSLQCVGN